MSDLMIRTSAAAVPLPSVDVTIRAGVAADVPFVDALQKAHAKQVGWMPTATLEEKIHRGHVLVAEHDGAGAGYLIGTDQYFKRDDVGIIYQMNVSPGRQRGLIGASLLRAQFERSAYGCRLYCCWCAQDIEANRFWEAMGFVPLAYRAGSEKKARVHVFWQKRIRRGDTTTPWWFPSKTAGGSIREDRIVLPIPPGTHWSDAKPLILPAAETPDEGGRLLSTGGRLLAAEKKPRRAKKPEVVEAPAAIRRNGLMFDIPRQGDPLPETKPPKQQKPKTERIKRTCDPRLVEAARELKDRWLEQINADPSAVKPDGKYDVSKALPARAVEAVATIPALPAPRAA